MKGYVAHKGSRWYAVIYEGIDPVTGRERRTWHAAGNERGDPERLAARLAAERNGRNGRNDEVRSLTFGAFLTRQWLPGKRVVLANSTYAGFRRNVERHIVPAGSRQLLICGSRATVPGPARPPNDAGPGRVSHVGYRRHQNRPMKKPGVGALG